MLLVSGSVSVHYISRRGSLVETTERSIVTVQDFNCVNTPHLFYLDLADFVIVSCVPWYISVSQYTSSIYISSL